MLLDPIFTATLAAKSLSELAKGDYLRVAQNLFERATKAQEHHHKERTDPKDPIEQLRVKCIQQICNLQHDVVLYVSDAEFLKRVLPLTLEHISNTYEATSEQELQIIGMSLSRIENALTAYKNDKKRRGRIRLFAVIVSLLGLIGIGLAIWICTVRGVTETYEVNILKLPVQVLFWSIIGSFAAILYRFTHAGDSELNEPLRWLFARPLTGIIMGAIAYLVLRVGLITIQSGQPATPLGGKEVVWLIAFLAGFSDRFSDVLLRNVVGKFGGDTTGDLLTLEVNKQTTQTETTRYSALDGLKGLVGHKRQTGHPANPQNNADKTENLDMTSTSSSPGESPGMEKEVKSTEQQQIIVHPSKSNGSSE
jgi:hypothetical protein